MKNLGLKLVSLALAAGIWWVVSAPHREPVIERRFAAPLSIVGTPRNFVITTPVPDSVSVRMRGRASDINAVSSQTLDVPVDVSWIQQSGDVTITMHPQAVHKPPDIEVVAIDPNKLHFHVEMLRQRAVAIRPFLIGQPPQGYSIGDPTASPDRALVSGPSSHIMKMSEVSTERINMTGRTATFVQDVAVVSDTPLVRVVAPVTTQVTVPVIVEATTASPAPSATDTTDTKEKSTQ
ncbi:MAG TPA: CdaR family protein [Thermoanaerobaculia bacterium]|nr:CdaR family protein [Thermoanaerobaculia bacterium]